jgi:aspartyl-tRNA(Asn)/glutamyl-tRNA(Gln) amidotransferase subunit A
MELALGIPDESKPFPYPRNPWDAARWAGGSSSGSAAGVAAGMFLAAVGSDTGGSIRIPSSYCGITGLKPTFGLVPKDGVIPLGNSLDVVGPMTRDARDCATVLAAMVGDRGAAPSSVAPSTGTVHRPLRIGVDRSNLSGDHVHPDLPAVFDAAVADLAAGGASVVDVQVPLYDEVTAATIITWNSESLAYHRDNLRTQWSDFGFSVRTALVAGSVFSAADYIQAQKVRRLAQQRLVAMFEDVDIVVSPPVTSVAPLVEGFDQAKLYASVFTNYWSGVGNPVLNLPIGFSDDGLPFGVQVAGRWFEEDLLLAVGSAYQERTSWHLAVPDLAEGEAVA